MIDGAVSGAPSSPSLVLEPVASIDDVRDEWLELSTAAQNIFTSWDWTALWWHHFGAAQALLHRARTVDGRTIAVLPLYSSLRLGQRVLRFMGHGAGDELGPVHTPGEEQLAADALRALLADLDGWDVFFGERMPGSGRWCARLGATPLRREANPFIEVGGRSWAEFLGERSSNFRDQVRRRERRLFRDQPARFRLADDPARLDADMEALFALHEARWAGTTTALAGRRRAFHRDFARRALARGWLRLWLLEIEDRPVATWYGFRYGDAVLYYQAGRDPAWDRYSPGFVLMAHSIREAIGEGVSVYRLLRGDEAYKQRFATGDEGLETLVLGRGARGRVAVHTGRHLMGVAPRSTQLLSRLLR